MNNYNDGKWHGWDGGECPVHPETMVKWVNTQGDSHETTAGTLSWNDEASPVVAFRVIKEHKEPREFWISPAHGIIHEKPQGLATCQYIHVREVLE